MKSPLSAGFLLVATAGLLITGCGGEDADSPPEIRYGVSVCADCDMIISDERFAAATMVRDDRGGTLPLLFDDIGDQLLYESRHPDLQILARWVHDHDTREWVRAEEAFYVRSDEIHTPMASGIAAFATREAAEAVAQRLETSVLSQEVLRSE